MRLGPQRLTRDIRIVQRLLVDSGRAVWLGDGHPPDQPPPLRDVERAVARVRALVEPVRPVDATVEEHDEDGSEAPPPAAPAMRDTAELRVRATRQ
jgi:hypothetical protein